MVSATTLGVLIRLAPSRAPKTRVTLYPDDYTCCVEASGLRASRRPELSRRRIERDVSAIRIANEAMTAPVRVEVISRYNAGRTDGRGYGALVAARACARGVKRDHRWRVLSQSGRTNQRSTNKYSCKQLNGSGEHVHFDLSSVSPHVYSPFSNYVDSGLGNFSMTSFLVTREVVVEGPARYGKNVNCVALQKVPPFFNSR